MKKRIFNQEKILGMAVILLAVLIASGILFFGFNAKIGPETARAIVSFCNPNEGTYYNTVCTTGACLPMYNVSLFPLSACGGGYFDPATNANYCYGCQTNCVYRQATYYSTHGLCSPGGFAPVSCSPIGNLSTSTCPNTTAQFCGYPAGDPKKGCTTIIYTHTSNISTVGLNSSNYGNAAMCLNSKGFVKCVWSPEGDGAKCCFGEDCDYFAKGVCTYQNKESPYLGKPYLEENSPRTSSAPTCPTGYDSSTGTIITGICPAVQFSSLFNNVSFTERRVCTKSPPTSQMCYEYPRCDPWETKTFGLGTQSDEIGGGSQCNSYYTAQSFARGAYCNPGWKAVSSTTLTCQVNYPPASPIEFIATTTCQRICGDQTYYHQACTSSVSVGGQVCRAVEGAGPDNCSDCTPVLSSYTTTCTVDKTLIDKNETVTFSATAVCSGNNCPTDAVTMTWDSSGVSSQNINCSHSYTTNVLETGSTATLSPCVSGPITYDTSGLVVKTRVGAGGETSTNCPSVTVKTPTLTFNCPVDQNGNATGACTTNQTVTIKNTAASGAASLTFNLNSNSSYGSVIIDTGSGTTIAQGGNKTYTPTFTLQSVLSTTIDNAGTLKISSTDANNHANVSIDSPQDINIKLVPVASIIITENQAPTIISVTNVSPTCPATNNCEVEVKWNNPQKYPGGVWIYVKPNSATTWPADAAKFFTSGPEIEVGTSSTAVVGNLTPNTTYHFKVRGWLR